MKNNKSVVCILLITTFLIQSIPVFAQQELPNMSVRASDEVDANNIYKILLQQARGVEARDVELKFFGDDLGEIFETEPEEFLAGVHSSSRERVDQVLDEEIQKRRERKSSPVVSSPAVKTSATKKPIRKATSKRSGFNPQPRFDWRQFAFGFQPIALKPDDAPDIKMTETGKEIKAEGSAKKNFETKDAKGTRTQKAETRYTKDGKTFGVEIKDTQIIDAVSKPDGKSFRREISIEWGAEVAACPDINGVTSGTGKAKVASKTTYIENGVSVTMTTEFDLQAKVTGYVNDQAEMTHYDLKLDAYTTNSGYENALQRNVIKEIKLKDGRYGLHYDILGNTIEVSDGTYGGRRTPAKLGKVSATKLVPMNDADTTTVGSAIGPMVPSIWNSANEMYGSAQKHWRNYGCVEVVCSVPRTMLKQGDEIAVSTQTVHLQDGGKVNAQLKAESYQSEVTPAEQAAKPDAKFILTQSGEDGALFTVESFSKRGIGKGDVDFQLEKEKLEAAGTWTGMIKAERKSREEREKRSGSNLAENGGSVETTTTVQLQLTGMLDRTVDATNAYIARVSGRQEMVDFEYDRYKIDEGYCGPNAVPYKGPKEITRTSTTTATYDKDTRVYLEIGGSQGSISFELPDINGTTVHKYVHRSPCADHDRANTNESTNDDAATPGGSFSFSFPIDPSQPTIRGSVTVSAEDGSTTTYTWELSRRS